MNIIRYPERESWNTILQRPKLDHSKLEDQVVQIIKDVKKNGDKAVHSYTKQFDGVSPVRNYKRPEKR